MRNRLPVSFFLVILSLALSFKSAGRWQTPVKENTGHAQAVDAPAFPHHELDEVRTPSVTGTQAGVQRSVGIPGFTRNPILYRARFSPAHFILRSTSLFISDHLSHNYPTHNFW